MCPLSDPWAKLSHSPTVIQTIHELLGHRDAKPTMMYSHVLNRGGKEVYSSNDHL